VRRGNRRFTVLLLAIALVALTSAASMSGGGRYAPDPPTRLTVDDDAAPLAVTGDPSFGWLPQDRDQNEIQTAYEIVVTDGQSPPIDTNKVGSSQQSYVHVPGLAARLQPNRVYVWRVRTWDRDDRESPFAGGTFTTGLRDRDWTAQWIRRPGSEQQTIADYSQFKQTVVLNRAITHARVAASAGQQYELSVNGERVAHGPSLAYPDEQYYETTDITPLLKPGGRTTFMFTTFWGQPAQGRPASVPGLIAQITIDATDGTRTTIGTDRTWETRAAGIVPDHPRNDEGDWVERADMRVAGSDGGWGPAAVIGPAGTAPFTHLIPARTHIVEAATDPVKVTHVGTATVADFGAVIAATPVVTLASATAGARVTVLGGDQLDPNGRVSRTNGIQSTDMSWLFDTRAGPQTLRPFGYLGFRYLEVDGAATPTIAAAARHAAMPNENDTMFESSDVTLNKVFDLARHSALYDSQEQFLDTPTREKGPFLGDGFDVSQATLVAFGDRALTAQALRDLARSQPRYWKEEGRVNVVYPNGDGTRDIPDATESYVEWVWQNYVNTGDRAQLAALYPVVQNIARYVGKAIDPKTGLVTNLPGGGEDYLYGAVDWPPQMRYGYDMTTTARTTVNVLAVDAFNRAGQMAEALGRPAAEAGNDRRLAATLTNAMRSKLTRADGVFVDGLRADGSQSPHAGQQANAWPLAFGIVPPAHVKAVADHIISLKNAMGGVYGWVLLDALHAAGRDDALVTALTDPARPGYAQILEQGATFTWESWNAPAVGDSESHGWGSTVLAVMLQDMLGVRVTDPGGAHVDISVPNTSLTSAHGSVGTQRGTVRGEWTRDASGPEVANVSVPVNVTATVHVGNEQGDVGSGTWTLDSAKPFPKPNPTSNGGGNATVWVIVAAAAVIIAGAVVFLLRRRRLHSS
jgi:alpha-L-rhamnosidase